MASLVYNSAIYDMVRGLVDFDTDTFKVMLVTSAYTASKRNHDKRDDVTNEVTGTGYTAGGVTTTCTVTLNNSTDEVTISTSGASWATSTITARGAVIYKSLGGASSADPLICYIDFGANVTSTASTFLLGTATVGLANPD
jgi:hypothetical protein